MDIWEPPIDDDEIEYLAGFADEVAGPGSTPAKRPAGGRRLRLTSAADITPTPVRWLWDGWLAKGKLHILGGHAGDGKSTISTALAATLSTGGDWPDGSHAPLGRTLVLPAEDGIADTIVPRLIQHGADLRRVAFLDGIEHDGRLESFSLSAHLDLLTQRLTSEGFDLAIIDPLTSYMPGSDRNAEGAVRDLLTPLAQLADQTGVAILAIMHVGKPSGTARRPLQQLLGATAFGAVARIVWMAAPIPGGDHRALGVVKSNLAPRPLALEWSRPLDSAIQWHGAADLPIETLLSESGMPRDQPRQDATDLLLELLGEGQPVPASTVKDAAETEGVAWRTIERASRDLGVVKRPAPGGPHGGWVWQLPRFKSATSLPGEVADLAELTTGETNRQLISEQQRSAAPVKSATSIQGDVADLKTIVNHAAFHRSVGGEERTPKSVNSATSQGPDVAELSSFNTSLADPEQPRPTAQEQPFSGRQVIAEIMTDTDPERRRTRLLTYLDMPREDDPPRAQGALPLATNR